MKINSFSYWDLKYYFLRSPKSAANVIFAISFMGTCTLILVSVHNILTVPLPCFLNSVRRVSTGIGETFILTLSLFFKRKQFHCLNMIIEHVISCKCFRVRKNLHRFFFDHFGAFIVSS